MEINSLARTMHKTRGACSKSNIECCEITNDFGRNYAGGKICSAAFHIKKRLCDPGRHFFEYQNPCVSSFACSINLYKVLIYLPFHTAEKFVVGKSSRKIHLFRHQIFEISLK